MRSLKVVLYGEPVPERLCRIAFQALFQSDVSDLHPEMSVLSILTLSLERFRGEGQYVELMRWLFRGEQCSCPSWQQVSTSC